ncbi:cupin domain-containing protein [Aestuariivirga sp.]|uniref:AraC family transcriptional regulator n=1 Tax=Aestuariivirga sp. TaxID=2650926 RepID=UPI0039E5AD2C
MIDPLSSIIELLRPQTVFTKGISGAGRWSVRYSDFGHPSFAIILEGSCRLTVDGQDEFHLQAGDFVLLPTTPGFTMNGGEPASPAIKPTPIDVSAAARAQEDVRHGDQQGPPEVRIQGGYFAFGGDEPGVLLSLLPAVIHVRGEERLSALMRLVGSEADDEKSGRDFVLSRLAELILVEALRSQQTLAAPAGLMRGLSDPRLAAALKLMHNDAARAWTMADLAKEAALSRSVFFERFSSYVGLPPMEYLLAWRMAVAKDLLRRTDLDVSQVAERVGYGSASAFSTAFSRHVGQPPGRYARSNARGRNVGAAA